MIEVRCSALLFDMDGVLIDSTPAAARVWRNWAIIHGFDPREVVARAHGRPSIMTIRDYLPCADHEAENRIVERQEIEDLEGVVPLPGARELLDTLPPERWTISTSATRPLAEVRLRAAGLCVPKTIVTATDITHGKPHPEPYLKAAAALGFAPETCVVVEDAVAGVQAGKAAGARVIGFTTTFAAEKLEAAGADWVVRDCSEMRLEASEPELRISLHPKAL